MEIRKMNQADDRMEISHIYEESWKYAYKDSIPQSYLESIPKGQWVPSLDKEGRHTLLMIEDGIFIGTVSYCKSRFEQFADYGEIVSIYFLPEYIGKGYGKQLFRIAINELKSMGFGDIFLWVLEQNFNARRFYEKAGFVLSDYYLKDTIGGKELKEVAYCYHIR